MVLVAWKRRGIVSRSKLMTEEIVRMMCASKVMMSK